MRFVSAGNTDIGLKRKVNQDSFRIEPSLNLYVVTDGMGGHAAGELASKIAVDAVVDSVLSDRSENLSSMTSTDLMIGAVHRANSAVFSRAEKDKKLAGMGTTVIAMLFDGTKVIIGHVGDSRAYVARKHQLWQITKDHSLVNEKLKAGIITREQLKKDKSRNVITRSVGFESSVLVDTYTKEINPGEVYLACSDGLTGPVSDEEIIAILDEYAFDTESLEPAVNKLIERANENGGDDNITVVLVRVEK